MKRKAASKSGEGSSSDLFATKQRSDAGASLFLRESEAAETLESRSECFFICDE